MMVIMKIMMLLINDHGHDVFDDLLVDDLKHPTLTMTFLQCLPTHLNHQHLTMERQQLSTVVNNCQHELTIETQRL